MEKVAFRLSSSFDISSFSSSDKVPAPLNILPTYINLANSILGPEYISIYVKYCYLDALVLLIQTFLEWTPGLQSTHFPEIILIKLARLVDIDQQQYELTRYSTVQLSLLDFVDYCNDIIDIHPSTTPQYKCAVKVDFLMFILIRHSSLGFPGISTYFSSIVHLRFQRRICTSLK